MIILVSVLMLVLYWKKIWSSRSCLHLLKTRFYKTNQKLWWTVKDEKDFIYILFSNKNISNEKVRRASYDL